MKKLFLIVVMVWAGVLAAREFDVGMVIEKRDPAFSNKKVPQKRVGEYLRKFSELKLKVKDVDADIFLPKKKDEIDKYKRIFIPYWHSVFSLPMYDGMAGYVQRGGLILTDSILNGIDTDGDFRQDYTTSLKKKQKTADHPRLGFHPPTGVLAHSTADVKSVTSQVKCPVTEGFETGRAEVMDFKMRMVTNHRATVVVTGDALRKGQETKAMPVVTFLHEGKGAFLYVPMEVERLFRNVFSEATLDWLCDQ